MIVGEARSSVLAIVFGGDFRCFSARVVFTILFVQIRFEAEEEEEFKLVLVDEHFSVSPEFAAKVAKA